MAGSGKKPHLYSEFCTSVPCLVSQKQFLLTCHIWSSVMIQELTCFKICVCGCVSRNHYLQAIRGQNANIHLCKMVMQQVSIYDWALQYLMLLRMKAATQLVLDQILGYLGFDPHSVTETHWVTCHSLSSQSLSQICYCKMEVGKVYCQVLRIPRRQKNRV